MLGTGAYAQASHTNDTTGVTDKERDLKEVTVTSRSGTVRIGGAMNGVRINREELFKAACCNLGESFTTNPSVDVSYSDAATGAKQIKLLGLSGTYVQMLTENMPNYRGAASPYSLGYVPGPWMKGISVSKGSASVKNGYESITGQINVDYLKPEDPERLGINLFGNTKTRIEANIAGNLHLNKNLSTELLTHYENAIEEHDGNGDGFYDQPKVRQYHVQNRWMYQNGRYIFHGGLGALNEKRVGGQMPHAAADGRRYDINIETDNYEAYMKHAVILSPEHGTNLALMTSASMHEQNSEYGDKRYYVNQKNAYASLMLETNFGAIHNLSTGMSVNYDYYGQAFNPQTVLFDGDRYMFSRPTAATGQPGLSQPTYIRERETVPGAYAQYTLNLHNRLTAMAGLRVDHSSMYGTFVTPRFHLKYAPADVFSVRLSVGKGYRTVHALGENNFLMASGRTLIVDANLRQEEAWNYGVSTAFNIPLAGKTLKLNAEYYYTRFGEQAVTDYDSNPEEIRIGNLTGKSYSHTMQVDATYPLFEGMTLTAAYRLNDVKSTYGGKLMKKPLTSKYKGLLTASYKTPLGLWQFDATLQLNGGGRMPTPYETADGTMSWAGTFPAFAQLGAQVTRWFRHWSVYAGGENLTGFTQKNPIIGASDPWDKTFDPTMIWGPVHGAVAYIGVRINIGNI